MASNGKIVIRGDSAEVTAMLKKLQADFKATEQGVNNSTQDMNKGMNEFATSIKNVLTALVGMRGVEAVKSTESMGLQMDILKVKSADVYAQLQKTGDISLGLANRFDMVASANRALAFGIDLTGGKFERLLKLSGKTAMVMGIDVKQAFNDLIVGVARKSRLILDNLGVIISLKEAYSEFARTLNKTSFELTEAEKQTAILNATIGQLEKSTDKITDKMVKNHTKGSVAIKTVETNMKKGTYVIVNESIKAITTVSEYVAQTYLDLTSAGAVNKVKGFFGTSVVGVWLSGVNKVGSALGDMFADNDNQAKASTEEMDRWIKRRMEQHQIDLDFGLEIVDSEEANAITKHDQEMYYYGLWKDIQAHKKELIKLDSLELLAWNKHVKEMQDTEYEGLSPADYQRKIIDKWNKDFNSKHEASSTKRAKYRQKQRTKADRESRRLAQKEEADKKAYAERIVNIEYSIYKDTAKTGEEIVKLEEWKVARVEAIRHLSKKKLRALYVESLNVERDYNKKSKALAKTTEEINKDKQKIAQDNKDIIDKIKKEEIDTIIENNKRIADAEKNKYDILADINQKGMTLISDISTGIYANMIDNQKHTMKEFISQIMIQTGGQLVADGIKNMWIGGGKLFSPATAIEGAGQLGYGALETTAGFGLGYAGKVIAPPSADVGDNKESASGDRADQNRDTQSDLRVFLYDNEKDWLKQQQQGLKQINKRNKLGRL